MNGIWWSLPGPTGCLERVAQDLKDGKSTLVRLPDHGVPDFGEALRRSYERDWRILEPDDRSPTEQLLSRFAPDHPVGAPRDVRAVVAAERLRGNALMCCIRASDHGWPDWSEFLEEYAERCRALEAFERAVFCVVLVGPPERPLPPASLCLTHHVWRGVTSMLDMDLYVSHLIRSRPARIEWRTAAAVVAHLAQWDPEVAERLVAEPLKHILEPWPLLECIARERGWDGGSVGEHGWERGMWNIVDGHRVLHSAALRDGADEEVAARVWAGQVGVLFPYLEEQRRALLRLHVHRLRVPYELPDGRQVVDRRDLELSHILWQLSRDGTAPAQVRRALETLVDMRNCLAHFEIVPPELLLDPEVHSFLSRLRDAEVYVDALR